MVIGSGKVPAQLLFIGEAPGTTEEVLGLPFVGDAGRILLYMKGDAAQLAGVPMPSHYTTNCLMCRPFIEDEDDDYHMANRKPTKEEALACRPNVLRVYEAVRPKIVVLLGRVPESYFAKEFPRTIMLRHPAYLLRLGGRAHPEYTIEVRKLSEVFKEVWDETN
jgi:DNA polymerase